MTSIDLDRIDQAMDWLAETPGGDQALEALAKACDALRQAIPVELNLAEMRYVLERLMQQRQIGGWDERLPEPEVAGFAEQAFAGLFPTQTGLTRASLPDALAGQSRILNFGFVIKASVPAATFTP